MILLLANLTMFDFVLEHLEYFLCREWGELILARPTLAEVLMHLLDEGVVDADLHAIPDGSHG